jgi:hypothetical protein
MIGSGNLTTEGTEGTEGVVSDVTEAAGDVGLGQ